MNNSKIQESWSVNRLNEDNHEFVLRFNSWLWNIADDNPYIFQVGIATPFNKKTANGYPTNGETQILNNIEDALYDEFHEKHGTIFAGLITGNNMREFVLYTKDPEIIKPFLEKVLNTFADYQFQINFQKDKKWEIYKAHCPK
jgi:hypothetical protein